MRCDATRGGVGRASWSAERQCCLHQQGRDEALSSLQAAKTGGDTVLWCKTRSRVRAHGQAKAKMDDSPDRQELRRVPAESVALRSLLHRKRIAIRCQVNPRPPPLERPRFPTWIRRPAVGNPSPGYWVPPLRRRPFEQKGRQLTTPRCCCRQQREEETSDLSRRWSG